MDGGGGTGTIGGWFFFTLKKKKFNVFQTRKVSKIFLKSMKNLQFFENDKRNFEIF